MPREKAGVDLHREWIKAGVRPAEPDRYVTFASQRVFIPMQQHVGAPCEPVVQKGERVRVGQVVGRSEEFMSAAVHTGVSGTVADITEVPQVRGGPVPCVVVDNDGRDEPAEPEPTEGRDNPAQVRRLVQKAGVVGMGGAAFPTHVKLDTKDNKVDTLVLNGAECEPGIFADNALMQQHPQEILAGAAIAMRAVGAARVLVGIEGDRPNALRAMEEAARASEATVEVHALPTLYPQGGEKQLIHALTGREVPEGGLPAKAGVVVLNVATARAIYRAVEQGAPLTSRVCTVTGDVGVPQNVRFPIGTPVGALLEFCGGFAGAPSKLIVGGPMMGMTVDDLAVPLVKASNGLVVVDEGHDNTWEEEPCIRCNRCVEVCPMYLVPWALDRYWRKEDMAGCRRFHAQSCINCGCCTYICPARRTLAEKITEAKNKLQKMDKEGGND